MPEQTWKLIFPPNNWSGAIEVPASVLPSLEEVARKNNGTYKEDVAQHKVYWHPTEARAASPPPEAPKAGEKKLVVPWYSQLNSELLGGIHATRMCQSSSIAMLIKSVRPNALSNRVNADDEYLARVLEFGDTTLQEAQLKAARKMLKNVATIDFFTDCNWQTVEDHLKRNIPFVVGYLHKGHVSHPTGDGHYSVIVGETSDKKAWYVHDPAGELDLINGRYISTDGEYQVYSKENLGKRFMCNFDGVHTPGQNGWGYIVKKVKAD